MTMQTTKTEPQPRRRLRSVASVLVAFIVVFVLSLGTDQMLHTLNVYPPWGEPMREPGLNLLALSYRIVYGVVGSYITATLAPYAPMRHVWVGACIGLAVTTLGVIAAIVTDIGPVWYPVALALTVLPTAWLGGFLHRITQSGR